MRRLTLYRGLTLVCLWAAGAAAALAVVALALSHGFEASAAGLCAAVFVVPGLLFLRHWRRLLARDLALVHVAQIADEEGVADAKTLGRRLDIPEGDAAKIIQIAIREGHAKGTVDDEGRYISARAPRCPKCGHALPHAAARGRCERCGAPLAGGG